MNDPGNVDVLTGSRLHFGLICGTPETGWDFGGIGMMVRQPGWQLRLTPLPPKNADTVSVPEPAEENDSDIRTRILATVDSLRTQAAESALPDPPPVAIEVLSRSPLHSGFGAGTQLTLAVAEGLHVLWRHARTSDLQQLSTLLGRAARSVIGTAGFARGGFIVDYGRPNTVDELRTPLRLYVPDAWQFLLIRPVHGTGLSGVAEQAYFEQCPRMTVHRIQSLEHLIENRLVTAIREQNFSEFAAALGEYGRRVGEFYAAAQGDTFSDPRCGALAAWLAANGIHGTAQSSWGPGICVPSENARSAAHIARKVAEYFSDPSGELFEITISSALNHGATIRSTVPDQRPDRWC